MPVIYIPYPTLRTPRRVLRERQETLTLHEYLIPFLFYKGVRGFQTCVPLICFRFIFQFISNLSCLFGLCTFNLSPGYSTLDSIQQYIINYALSLQKLTRNGITRSPKATVCILPWWPSGLVCWIRCSLTSSGKYSMHIQNESLSISDNEWTLFCTRPTH